MTTSKKWLTICVAAGLIAACTLAAPPSAGAAFTETKLSDDFDWKYEMTTLMPSEENLDNNFADPPTNLDPIYDFRYKKWGGSSASIIEGGLLSMLSTGGSAYVYFGADDIPGRIWKSEAENFTFADGYTIEARIKVISSTGDLGAWGIAANPVDVGDQPESRLNIAADGLFWGDTALGGVMDNTDDFHVFRIAQEEGQDNFRVWRDGVPVGTDIAAPASVDYKRLVFGDLGSAANWKGEVEIDYFRFIKGAYSPGDTPPPIPGDANNDRVVDDKDASILAANWQQSGGWSDGDFNGDTVVNDQDASILAAHWGQTGESASAPVPEPSTLVLLGGIVLIGLVGLARRRR